MSLKFENFDVTTVPLQDTNLIEASAGTGKTYSIAILALRLIIEKEIPIQQILLVTFTKNAVAELEIRLRTFIENAWRVVQGKSIRDLTIVEVVTRAIDQKGKDSVQNLLRNAFLFLDETSVLTIHSFCQQVLNEFAFETNQLFGATLTTDRQSIIDEEVKKFWRKNITILPVEVLRKLSSLSLGSISKIVTGHINGKRYHGYDADKKYIVTSISSLEWLKENVVLKLLYEQEIEKYYTFVKTNSFGLEKRIAENRYAKKPFLNATSEPEAMRQQINLKVKTSKYISELFPDLLELEDNITIAQNEIDKQTQQFLAELYKFAIQQITIGVNQFMESHNQMSFDDLIHKLHTALVKQDNPQLVALLRKKYKAVFIDEFQDTDALQYDIFNKAFGEEVVLFYIGDPKQSIYGFRSADIFTYLKARDNVKHIYGMNTNYRSSAAYVAGMNQFFKPTEDFDTFFFEGEPDAIDYLNVDAAPGKSPGLFLENNKSVPALNIIEDNNGNDLINSVAAMCANLLDDNFSIEQDGKKRKVRPSDIGILVDKNKVAKKIRAALSAKHIPAVTLSDEKIFESEEAAEVLNLLIAMQEIKISNINRALFSLITNFKSGEILKLNTEKLIELFSGYKELWLKSGVFVAMNSFLADFNITSNLLNAGSVSAERTYTNLQQLIEILYKKERLNQYSPADLIASMQRLISEGEEGDEYLQRIEREEEAVRIITLHKAKGLEYNIVLLPNLDFNLRRDPSIISYRDNVLNEYVSIEKPKASDEAKKLYEQQAEQEFRRLLYVAVTRGVHAAYIFSNGSGFNKSSTLKKFLPKGLSSNSIVVKDKSGIDYNLSYNNAEERSLFSPERVALNIPGNSWQRSSYSSLESHLPIAAKERRVHFENEYDAFIFRGFKPGVKSGNIIHQVFEFANFADEKYWPDLVQNALEKYDPAALETQKENYLELVKQVVAAKFPAGNNVFQLSEIENGKRLHELEFNFTIKEFDPLMLAHHLNSDTYNISVNETGEIEGVLNGIIDMFFEHQGKYYVLDWKSTYLGPTLESYISKGLADAMSDNNYHLQYLIYTIAAKKYLQSRLPSFNYENDFGGVFYAFVRGMREGSSTGIFFNKPSLEVVEKMEKIFGD